MTTATTTYQELQGPVLLTNEEAEMVGAGFGKLGDIAGGAGAGAAIGAAFGGIGTIVGGAVGGLLGWLFG